MVHFESGDFKNAQNRIEEAVRLSQNNNEKHFEGISKIWLGRILGKAETSGGRGEEYILQGIKILDDLKIRPYSAQGYLFLGELYADRGCSRRWEWIIGWPELKKSWGDSKV